MSSAQTSSARKCKPENAAKIDASHTLDRHLKKVKLNGNQSNNLIQPDLLSSPQKRTRLSFKSTFK